MKSQAIKSKVIRAKVNDLVHMGWLYPNSRVAELICSDLVADAQAQQWDAKRFIHAALPRVRAWAAAELGIQGALLDTTYQNFCARVATRRPDLFFDDSKGAIKWYVVNILKNVHHETCREERFSQHDDFLLEVEDPGQGPLEALAENREAAELARQRERKHVVKILYQLIDQLPPDQRVAVAQQYCKSDAQGLPDNASESARRVRRCRGLQKLRDKAEALGLRLSGIGVARGRVRRLPRKPRGRALPRRSKRIPMQLRESPNSGTIIDVQQENLEMAVKQRTIDASNARALKALFDSLPESLRERVDVLAAVRDTFEREFARHIKRPPHPMKNIKEPPSS